MAIPPHGVKIICEAILSTLYKIDYESISPNINVDKTINKLGFI